MPSPLLPYQQAFLKAVADARTALAASPGRRTSRTLVLPWQLGLHGGKSIPRPTGILNAIINDPDFERTRMSILLFKDPAVNLRDALAAVQKMARRRNPSDLASLKEIAKGQRERLATVHRRDSALYMAAKNQEDPEEASKFRQEAARLQGQLKKLPAGNRAIRRAAERGARRKPRVSAGTTEFFLAT